MHVQWLRFTRLFFFLFFLDVCYHVNSHFRGRRRRGGGGGEREREREMGGGGGLSWACVPLNIVFFSFLTPFLR